MGNNVRRLHPLVQSKIELPNIPSIRSDNMSGGVKDESVYEHIKYLFICKSFESERPFKIGGRKQITRCYGIGILTDSNKYYFSEIHTRHTELTNYNINLFKSAILTHYTIDKNTKIAIPENIKMNEPIRLFFAIVIATMKSKSQTIKEMPMFRAFQRLFNYVKTNKKSISKYHRKEMVRRLIEMDRFDFITEPDWYEKLKLKRKRTQDAFMSCAIGILYLNVREYLTNFNKKYKKAALERKQKEQQEK
jgi:hypothetical protein